MMAIAETPALTAILCALVEERTGLHYVDADRGTLMSKLVERATQAGYESLLDYYYFLRYDPGAEAELRELIDALVINETYFFRELRPIEVVLDRVIGPAIAAGRRPRVWSAACATGEEPLSLAMLLGARLPKVELVASDISVRALERARSGRYGRRSRRVATPSAALPWLQVQPDETVTIDRALIDAIDWRRLNLCDDADVASVGVCDVIVCRNVLIYFSEATVVRVVERLIRALAPGGVLLVGVSESLLRFDTKLSCEEEAGVFFYRKPA